MRVFPVNTGVITSVKPMIYKLAVIILIAVLITAWSGSESQNREIWEPLRWVTRSSTTDTAPDHIVSAVERIMNVFQEARPLNPPRGLGVSPRADYHGRLVLQGDMKGPETVCLRMRMFFPDIDAFRPTAGVNVRINDPLTILGDAVIEDGNDKIFLLPPVIGKTGSQSIHARTAHPPGFIEEFPGSSLFPLWASDQEPFLRSVVRPVFGLYNGSVSTIFTSGGRPFWKPVSQERWIMTLIAKAREELDDFLSGVEAAEAEGVTQQQMSQMQSYLGKLRKAFDEYALIVQHEEMVEQMKKMHNMMAAMNPGEADKFWKEFTEGADRQLEESLAAAALQRPEIELMEKQLLEALIAREEIWREADLYIRTKQWDKLDKMGKEYDVGKLVYYADAGRIIEKLEAELNNMSMSQRQAPAFGFELPEWHPLGTHRHVVALPFEAVRPSGLVAPGSEGARALVTIDEEFFLSAESDGDILFMEIEWWEEVDARFRGKGGMFYNERRVTMLDELWSSLNWNSLKSMVR